MQYRTRPRAVAAVQLTATTQPADFPCPVQLYTQPVPHAVARLSEDAAEDMFLGDWLVTREGRHEIVKPGIFDALYEKVPHA